MSSELTDFTHFFGFSIVDTEEVNTGWKIFLTLWVVSLEGFLSLSQIKLIHYEIHKAVFHKAV